MLLEGDLLEALREKAASIQLSTQWCQGTSSSSSLATMMEEACQQTTAELIAAEQEMRPARRFTSTFEYPVRHETVH
jgi:hypothetical protein